MNEIVQLEVAGASRDPFSPPFGGLIQPRDDTLLTRGGGRGLWIYDDIERDAHAYAVLQKRKLAVIARDWQVDAASEDARDEAAAELVRRALERIDFDRASSELLDAILKGFAVTEVMWEVVGSEVLVADLRARDQRRFVFDEAGAPRLLVPGNLYRGEELPPRKFVVHRFGAKDHNPWGLGLGTRLFWPVLFKRQGVKFWLTFADKFGAPTVTGRYPAGASEKEKDTLLEAINTIRRESSVIFQQGMEVELLEAARSGNINTYETLVRYMDEQISAAVLGEAESARTQGGALAAAALTRQNVRLELVKADADLLSQTLNRTLVRWLVELNLPGANPPTIWRDVSEPEDLKARAERDSKVSAMGFKPTIEYIRETYGEGWDERAEAPPKPPGAPGVGAGAQPGDPEVDPAPDFAEGDAAGFPDQAAVDRAIAAIPASELDRQAVDLLKPAMDLIARAAGYEEILARLASVYPTLSTERLEELLARALFVMDIWGRISAQGEAAAGNA